MTTSTRRGCQFCGAVYDIRFGHRCDDEGDVLRGLFFAFIGTLLLLAAGVAVYLAVRAAV